LASLVYARACLKTPDFRFFIAHVIAHLVQYREYGRFGLSDLLDEMRGSSK
jgi:hypothetical protein